jgi:hypothetical protein
MNDPQDTHLAKLKDVRAALIVSASELLNHASNERIRRDYNLAADLIAITKTLLDRIDVMDQVIYEWKIAKQAIAQAYGISTN